MQRAFEMLGARATLKTRLAASIEAKQVLLSDSNTLATFEAVAKLAIDTYKSGGRLYIAGNGGSAADAQHLAAVRQ
jgi:D-sedoheptulose 7-phosphate isomerase